MEGIELENISIPLIKGDKGDKGDTGNTGATGAAGVGISSAELVDGELVLHLTNGTDVNVGNVEGTSVESLELTEDYDLVITLSDGSEQTVGNIEDLLGDILSDYYDKDTADSIFSTIDETGNKISLSINSSTYVMTLTLKDKNNNTLSTGTVDLPLESVVVSGSYDSVNKKIVLTLQSGSTIEFSVADLVSGLQTEITNANKLSADLVDDTNTTNKFVTASDKTTWNAKVDTTDYATSGTGGVVRIGNGASIVSNSGILQAATTDSFNGMGNNYFIGYGTLKNYLTHISNEVATNKVTSLSSSSTDTQYPSAKCVYDLVGDIATTLDTIQGEVI